MDLRRDEAVLRTDVVIDLLSQDIDFVLTESPIPSIKDDLKMYLFIYYYYLFIYLLLLYIVIFNVL